MKDSNVILTGGADAKELLTLITDEVEANYYTDKGHLLENETDVEENDIRKFKVTISVEEITS
jgi:hypothetical protein